MNHNVLKKGLVFAIIILFVGASAVLNTCRDIRGLSKDVYRNHKSRWCVK